MTVRRIVAGPVGDGRRDGVLIDGPAPRDRTYRSIPGMADVLLWHHVPSAGPDVGDPSIGAGDVPGLHEVVFKTVQFPPDAVFSSPSFDPAAAAAETAALTPQLASLFDPDGSGFHRTPTVDFAVLVRGALVLEMDDGSRVDLQPGDTIVQRGGRHRWSNPGEEPALIAVVQVGTGDAESVPSAD